MARFSFVGRSLVNSNLYGGGRSVFGARLFVLFVSLSRIASQSAFSTANTFLVIPGLLFLPAAGRLRGGQLESPTTYNFVASRSGRNDREVEGLWFSASGTAVGGYYNRFSGASVLASPLA